uniref:Putative BA/THIF-type NAD/FAD binding protein n=1 Tax=Magnetococcus massalia (strain MO-1) TaxID=451514 RepID=A0A1S7LK30_MAGMO|nr:Putative BA/THIF-type NAD/FAD binding protein [Candidatus Magnetococcus massalia]
MVNGKGLDGSLLLIGAGGLGSASALALGSLGFTRLTIIDDDLVEISNLQRQVAYRQEDLGQPKVMALRHQLQKLYPAMTVTALQSRLAAQEMTQQFAQHLLVLDGSDNFATRFAANDAALQAGLPLVHGAITGWRGQVTSIHGGRSPCLRCLFGGPPEQEGPACREAGVVGSGVGEIGWMMALEAYRILARWGEPLYGRLATVELKRGVRREVGYPQSADCICAGV